MVEEEHYTPNTVKIIQRIDLEELNRSLPKLTVTALWKDRQIDDYIGDTKVYSDSYLKLNAVFRKRIREILMVNFSVNNILNHVEKGHGSLEYGRMYRAGIKLNLPDISKIKKSFKSINTK